MTVSRHLFSAAVFLLVASPSWAVDPTDIPESPLSSEGLVQEALSEVKNPHAFDWRKSSYELELGYDYADEKNNFENDGAHLGLAFPTSSGFLTRLALRRMLVYGSESSNKVGRTPFRQPAGVSRYELMVGGGMSLVEGRAITRLSPWLPDLEHVLHFTFGVHYSHPNKTWIPRRDDPPDTLPGQRPVNSRWVLEAGLKYQLYLPSAFGLFYEISRHFPLQPAAGQRSWTVFSGGLTWAASGR